MDTPEHARGLVTSRVSMEQLVRTATKRLMKNKAKSTTHIATQSFSNSAKQYQGQMQAMSALQHGSISPPKPSLTGRKSE